MIIQCVVAVELLGGPPVVFVFPPRRHSLLLFVSNRQEPSTHQSLNCSFRRKKTNKSQDGIQPPDMVPIPDSEDELNTSSSLPSLCAHHSPTERVEELSRSHPSDGRDQFRIRKPSRSMGRVLYRRTHKLFTINHHHSSLRRDFISHSVVTNVR